MNIVLKISIGTFMVAGGAAALLAAILFLNKHGILGHSDFYDFLDVDLDNELSYEEWMRYYSLAQHKHPIENCMRADFYHADCNQDDRLTWKEYHNFRFQGESCASSATPTLRQWFESDPQSNKSTGSRGYALSTVPEGRIQNETYRKYISTLLARENELKLRYGIE